MVDVRLDSTMDPALSTRLSSFIGTLKSAAVFSPFYSWIGNANENGKDVWITTDLPAGNPALGAGWYDEKRTTQPYINGRYDWKSATDFNASSPAGYAEGISVVYLGIWSTSHSMGWPAATISPATPLGVGTASIERMVFHELAHGVTKADNFVETVGAFKGNYNEEIATALENVFYVPYAKAAGLSDDFLAKGHTYPSDHGALLGGTVGVDYLMIGDPGETPVLVVNPFTKAVQLEAEGMNGPGDYGEVIKTYHAPDHQELGNSYSRYITIEYSSYGGVFKRTATGIEFDGILGDRILPDAIFGSKASAQAKVEAALAPMSLVRAGYMDTPSVVLNTANLDNMISTYVDYENFDRALLLGADRHYDIFFDPSKNAATDPTAKMYVDVVGVTQKGSTATPSVLAIDGLITEDFWFDDETGAYVRDPYDRPYTDTIIFGGGGVDRRDLVSDPGNLSNALNTVGASDLIQGGTGRDMIIAGNEDASKPNTLKGGDGGDILVAGTVRDLLFGEDGPDMFVMASGTSAVSGGAQVDGGAGFDAISFLRTGAVTFATTGIATYGGRSVSTTSIEMVIGSDHADDLSGGVTTGGSMYLLGGKDDDIFRLSNGAIAIGGDGDDTFRIENVGQVNARYLLVGFDAGDRLFLNGMQHFGSQANVTPVGPATPIGYDDLTLHFSSGGGPNPFASSYLASQSWVSPSVEWRESFMQTAELSLIRIEHKTSSGTFTTEVYMTGFMNGMGDMDFSHAKTQVKYDQNLNDHYTSQTVLGAAFGVDSSPEAVGALFNNTQLSYDMWF